MSLPIDHARLPKPGDTFAEKYRLECILGSGGMGVVFGATHLLTHKRVAIKWLAVDPSGGMLSDTTHRFMREARLAGEFHHPNVVQVYDLGESQGSFFMVMEWLEGESLAGRLERVRRLSFQEALTSLVPCMQAIQRAHDAGIIHRDIKPANIFLCEPTQDRPALAKVLDFGISKRISSNQDVGTFVTRTGMLIGTPHYLAPEQLRARPVDCRTDIYGFGVLLYETLAGVLPFTADNFGDLVVQISTSTPRTLRELVPDLPVGVEQVVAKAMARNPDERHATLRELIASLEAIDPSPLSAATWPQRPVPTSMSPITIEGSGGRSSGNLGKRRVVALLAAAAIGAAVTGLALRQSPPPRAKSAPQSIVRPRALPPPTAAEPSPEPVDRESAIPSGIASAALGTPLPGPQLDASIDSGKPSPLSAARNAAVTDRGESLPSARGAPAEAGRLAKPSATAPPAQGGAAQPTAAQLAKPSVTAPTAQGAAAQPTTAQPAAQDAAAQPTAAQLAKPSVTVPTAQGAAAQPAAAQPAATQPAAAQPAAAQPAAAQLAKLVSAAQTAQGGAAAQPVAAQIAKPGTAAQAPQGGAAAQVAKPNVAARAAPAPTQAQAQAPTNPAQPQPTAAAPGREPSPHDGNASEPSSAEDSAREHNPLHMDIQ